MPNGTLTRAGMSIAEVTTKLWRWARHVQGMCKACAGHIRRVGHRRPDHIQNHLSRWGSCIGSAYSQSMDSMCCVHVRVQLWRLDEGVAWWISGGCILLAYAEWILNIGSPSFSAWLQLGSASIWLAHATRQLSMCSHGGPAKPAREAGW